MAISSIDDSRCATEILQTNLQFRFKEALPLTHVNASLRERSILPGYKKGGDGMPSLVDELLQEHREIRRVLKVVASQLDTLQSDAEADWALVGEAMDYLTRYPDLFHHGCEEVLFRHLHRHDPESREFVADLGREHGLLRELGLTFLALSEEATQGGDVQPAALESAGRRYLVMQERHMRKEEQTVFPRLREALPAEVWEDIREDLQHMPGWRLDRGGTLRQFDALRAHLERS